MKSVLKKQYIAELIGTFGLTLMVSLTLMSGVPEAVPFLAAITLTIFVYTIGPISGCQLNPAVTIGLWSVRKTTKQDAAGYIVAQLLGALLAMQLTVLLVGDSPTITADNLPIVGLAEVLGTMFLVFGVCAVVYGKTSNGASGVTIGGSLLLGIMVASTVSNGVLNPAVALGIGSLSVTYIVAPIVGGILSAQLYHWLAQ